MRLALLACSHQTDNHLNQPTKQLLAEALKTCAGSIILISHDQGFVEKVGVNRNLLLGVA